MFNFLGGVIKPVVFFGRPDLIDYIGNESDFNFDIAAHVVENHWEGRVTIEFHGVDILRRAW